MAIIHRCSLNGFGGQFGTTTKFARTLSKIPGCSSLAMIPCLVNIFNLLPLVCLFQFTVFEFFSRFQLISTRFKNLLLNLPFFVSSAKILQFFLFGSPVPQIGYSSICSRLLFFLFLPEKFSNNSVRIILATLR